MNFVSTGTKISGSAEPAENVYLNARREWNERYGDYIAQARSWRLVATGSIAIAALAVAGMTWIASQSRIVPYVVQTDRLGDAVAVRRADVAVDADPRIIRAQLARWIEDVRAVYSDVAAQRQVVTEAYALVNRNGPAAQQLNDWFAAHDPFTRARLDLVNPSVQSVLPLAGHTWRVEWMETTRSREGALEKKAYWDATLTISVHPPTDDATILRNPTGLYIDSFNWSERQ